MMLATTAVGKLDGQRLPAKASVDQADRGFPALGEADKEEVGCHAPSRLRQQAFIQGKGRRARHTQHHLHLAALDASEPKASMQRNRLVFVVPDGAQGRNAGAAHAVREQKLAKEGLRVDGCGRLHALTQPVAVGCTSIISRPAATAMPAALAMAKSAGAAASSGWLDSCGAKGSAKLAGDGCTFAHEAPAESSNVRTTKAAHRYSCTGAKVRGGTGCRG